MKQALVNLLLYGPVAFPIIETYLAFALYGPGMPPGMPKPSIPPPGPPIGPALAPAPPPR